MLGYRPLMDDDEEPCGETFTIGGVDIIAWPGKVVQAYPDVELMCSLPRDHTPRNKHSDGVHDWIELEERE
jgi:hypothetical protein